MRLYDLAEQYTDLLDLLEQDADNEALQAMLDGLQDAIENKVDAVLSIRNSKRAEAKALREEAARLTERAARAENEANRLEGWVESAMYRTGIEKMRTAKFSAWLQLNNPKVVVLDEAAIPREYFSTPAPQLLKNALIEAYNKDGLLVSGIEIQRTKSLRVR